MNTIDIRTVDVVQYLQPLREGGSMPAIVKANDDFLYVLKFRGSGQGKKSLIAEFIGGELARAIGLKVPELVFMNLEDSFRQTEPDEEIQDLLKFSVGLNLGLHFLYFLGNLVPNFGSGLPCSTGQKPIVATREACGSPCRDFTAIVVQPFLDLATGFQGAADVRARCTGLH